MFRYVSEALYVQICYNLYTFPQWKHEHWIKPRSKFSFHFVDIFEWKVHAEGILDNSFLSLHNSQNSVNRQKKETFCNTFLYKIR